MPQEYENVDMDDHNKRRMKMRTSNYIHREKFRNTAAIYTV